MIFFFKFERVDQMFLLFGSNLLWFKIISFPPEASPISWAKEGKLLNAYYMPDTHR